MHVYLPPGYEKDTEVKYPVLYLNHGGGDDDAKWTNTGRDGGHDWNNWRRYLHQTAQIMFPAGGGE